MPLHYGSSTEEHMAVRGRVGLFDLSHMGLFFVRGATRADALHFLQRVTTNDLRTLQRPGAQYSCFVNGEGMMLDDLLLYRMPSDADAHYMLVVNAANISSDFDWLDAHRKASHPDIVLTNASAEMAILAIQGPLADDLLTRIDPTHQPLASHVVTYRTLLHANTLMSATGYTGSGGYELYLPAHRAVALWRALLTAGEACGLQVAGLAARDSLRLEMGYCLYGRDADATVTPLEAGLSWIVKWDKGHFVGKEALLAQRSAGLTRRLVGLIMDNKHIPRTGYPLQGEYQKEVGRVTSGGFSPTLRRGIGMGYVATPHHRIDTPLHVVIRGTPRAARVTPLPFYQPPRCPT